MALTMWDLRCHVEDAAGGVQAVDVRADQRDLAAWEADRGSSSMQAMRDTPQLVFRWLAWHALHRTGRTALGWAEWSDGCLEVEPLEDDEAPDPGTPTAPATT